MAVVQRQKVAVEEAVGIKLLDQFCMILRKFTIHAKANSQSNQIFGGSDFVEIGFDHLQHLIIEKLVHNFNFLAIN